MSTTMTGTCRGSYMDWDQHIVRAETALRARQFEDAGNDLRLALEIARDGFDHTDERIPYTFMLLGVTNFGEARFPEAEANLKRANKIICALPAADSRAIGLSHLYLGCAYKLRGEDTLAESHYRKAVPLLLDACTKPDADKYFSYYQDPARLIGDDEVTEQETGLLDPFESADPTSVLVQTYNELSEVLMSMWTDLEGAGPLAIEIVDKMGVAALKLSLTDRAKKLLQLALCLAEVTYGFDDLRAAQVKLHLAHLYRIDRQYEVAFEQFRSAYDVYAKHFKKLERDWIEANVLPFEQMIPAWEAHEESRQLLEQATQLQTTGELEDALDCVAEAYDCLKDFFSEDDPICLPMFSILGQLFSSVGKNQQALHMAKVVERIIQKQRLDLEYQTSVTNRLAPLPEENMMVETEVVVSKEA
ncbi:MAG: hypothetical protein K2Z81_26150 [Cyanobacteria bacterium]|nr:hypothetical protein [Cyanobacteriota bacterium]